MLVRAPARTCVGCRTIKPANELTRFVANGDTLAEDRHGSGRGAWLCAGDLGCLDRAIRSRAFARALRTEISSSSLDAIERRWRGSGTEA
jgi:uncharacterized protein